MERPPSTPGVVSSLRATVELRAVANGAGGQPKATTNDLASIPLTYGAASLLRRGLTKLARGAVMQIVRWQCLLSHGSPDGNQLTLSDGTQNIQCEVLISLVGIIEHLSDPLNCLVRVNGVAMHGCVLFATRRFSWVFVCLFTCPQAASRCD